MGRISRLLSNEERKILRFYLQYGERLEGFSKLLKKLEKLGSLKELHSDIELIEEFWSKFKASSQ